MTAPPDDAPERALQDAMQRASRDRSMTARHALYHRLLAARFEVPLRDDDDDDVPVADDGDIVLDPRRFAVVEDLHGDAVVAAFTEPATLASRHPGGARCARVVGWRLFPLLHQLRLGSLRINPGGRFGGELYRHEIETLADAVQRTRGGRD